MKVINTYLVGTRLVGELKALPVVSFNFFMNFWPSEAEGWFKTI